jgi:hypothetical protein
VEHLHYIEDRPYAESASTPGINNGAAECGAGAYNQWDEMK